MRKINLIAISILLILGNSCRTVEKSTQKSLDLRSDRTQTVLDSGTLELRTLELGSMEVREILETETFDTLGRITHRTRKIVENIEKSETGTEEIKNETRKTEDTNIIEIDQKEDTKVSRKFNLGSLLVWLGGFLLLFGVITFVFRFVRKGSLL